MEYAVINEEIIHIPISKHNILTILATRDIEGRDIIKFKVDMTNFTHDQKEQLYGILRFFYLSQDENLLPIMDGEEYQDVCFYFDNIFKNNICKIIIFNKKVKY